MTGRQYHDCMEWTGRYIGVGKVRLFVKILTALSAVCYGGTLLLLWLQAAGWVKQPDSLFWNAGDGGYRLFWKVLLVPAVSFLAVTVFRSILSAPRPYEVYQFQPLLEKDTKGKSFPSRHVFSNLIIAMAVLRVSVPVGIFLMVCGVCLALLRVITGVHFPKDVLAGAIIAIAVGGVGFFL